MTGKSEMYTCILLNAMSFTSAKDNTLSLFIFHFTLSSEIKSEFRILNLEQNLISLLAKKSFVN